VSASRIGFAFVAIVTLNGCGLFVPEMEPFFVDASHEKEFENIIINNVKCELRKGVFEATKLLNSSHSAHPGNDISWLLQQGATVTLKLAVDEKSSFNPGISLSHPLQNALDVFPQNGNVNVPRSTSLSAGVSGSADGTRTEIVAFTYSFSDLINERGAERFRDIPCDNENGVFIQSDLKIAQFLVNKVFLAKVPGSVVIQDVKNKKLKEVKDPFSTFSYQVTFVASYGGSITPTWKFTQLSVNPGSTPFFSTSGQRTQDLTVSIGETKPATKTKAATPSPGQIMLLDAALIGQAVASAIQSQTHQ
jgi:hypothetical protein